MNAPRRSGYAGLVAVGLLGLAQSLPANAGSPPHYPPGWDHRPQHAQRHHDNRRPVVVDRYPDRRYVVVDRHPDRHYVAERYPDRRYVVVDRLPRGCRHVVYRGQPYYYQGANWYRPYGARYAAVAPPAGLIIDSRGVMLEARVPLVRW